MRAIRELRIHYSSLSCICEARELRFILFTLSINKNQVLPSNFKVVSIGLSIFEGFNHFLKSSLLLCLRNTILHRAMGVSLLSQRIGKEISHIILYLF